VVEVKDEVKDEAVILQLYEVKRYRFLASRSVLSRTDISVGAFPLSASL
jgi:hypothetical protein